MLLQVVPDTFPIALAVESRPEALISPGNHADDTTSVGNVRHDQGARGTTLHEPASQTGKALIDLVFTTFSSRHG